MRATRYGARGVLSERFLHIATATAAAVVGVLLIAAAIVSSRS